MTQYNVLLSIATNIPVLLMTAFVLQGHIYIIFFSVFSSLTHFKWFCGVTNKLKCCI